VRRRRALLLSAAAAFLLAGCGGSGRLSHDAFVAKANAICADYHARAAKLPLPHTIAAYAEYARRTLPFYRSALAQLAALRPPSADEPAVLRLLDADRAIERDIVRIEHAASSGNAAAVDRAVGQARKDNARAARLARSLDLGVCAQA
jgi:hypothetical protein